MSKERLYFIGDIRLVGKKNGVLRHLIISKGKHRDHGSDGIQVDSYDPHGNSSSRVFEVFSLIPEVDSFHYKEYYTKAEVLKLADDINEYYCCEDLKVKCGSFSLGIADNKHAKKFKIKEGLKFTHGCNTLILYMVAPNIYKFFREGSYNRLNDNEIAEGEYVRGDFERKYSVKLIEQ